MRRLHLVAIALCPWLSLAASAESKSPPDPATLNWVLPVRSARLSPGPVLPRTLRLPRHDAVVPGWAGPCFRGVAVAARQALQDLGANGLAVEVDNVQALRRIQTAAPGLNIWPVSGDDIAERLELDHYPVLITPTNLQQ